MLEVLGFFAAAIVVLLVLGLIEIGAVALVFEFSAWRGRRRRRRRRGFVDLTGTSRWQS